MPWHAYIHAFWNGVLFSCYLAIIVDIAVDVGRTARRAYLRRAERKAREGLQQLAAATEIAHAQARSLSKTPLDGGRG